MLPRIYEKSPAELVQWCQEQGLPTYRAGQIQQQIFPNRATQFGEMTNLPAKLREQLAAAFTLFPSEVVAHQIAKDRTEKLLLQLHDGSLVECVLMREDDRRTICISTQVGCGMGCVFCASGLLGLKRNLTTGEILEQVLRLDRLLPADEKLTNVVVMGMGEPLANLKNLLPALDRLTADDGLGLGARRITVSTVGLPEKFASWPRQAISSTSLSHSTLPKPNSAPNSSRSIGTLALKLCWKRRTTTSRSLAAG